MPKRPLSANATPTPEARITAAIEEIKSVFAETHPGLYITSRAVIRDGGIACIAVGASFFDDDVATPFFASRDFLESFDRGEIGASAAKGAGDAD